MSLSKTLKGLHWNRIPGDNDGEVAARGILYLLIFQQLGQLVRWSWGYHVLLAPRERYLEEAERQEGGTRIEQGQERYTDNPEQIDPDEPLIRSRSLSPGARRYSDNLSPRAVSPHAEDEFPSGEQTPVTSYAYSKGSSQGDRSHTEHSDNSDHHESLIGPPPEAPFLPRQSTVGDMMTFPNVELAQRETHNERGCVKQFRAFLRRLGRNMSRGWEKHTGTAFRKLPTSLQKALIGVWAAIRKFVHGVWDFMNPPLWAMLVAIVVASVPSLQRIFFTSGTFVNNSVTRAVNQNAQVAVPLILVVLGANLARNTLPDEALGDIDHPKEERKLIIASLVARMLLPTIIMAPILALLAKYVPISILDDPIFIIVCFLLTGAPSALQLAQICQLNNVYVSAMSKLLFQSYVIWYVWFFFSPRTVVSNMLTIIGFFRRLYFWSWLPWKFLNGHQRQRNIILLLYDMNICFSLPLPRTRVSAPNIEVFGILISFYCSDSINLYYSICLEMYYEAFNLRRLGLALSIGRIFNSDV